MRRVWLFLLLSPSRFSNTASGGKVEDDRPSLPQLQLNEEGLANKVEKFHTGYLSWEKMRKFNVDTHRLIQKQQRLMMQKSPFTFGMNASGTLGFTVMGWHTCMSDGVASPYCWH
jgi:hypothetical protein